MQLTARRGSYNSETNCNVTGNAYREGRRTCPSTENHVPTKTILVADDERSILTVRRLLFEALGYCVLTADSGTEALDLLRAHSVDAVVLDYAMSPMNGEETARRVRQQHRDIPSVLSSGCLSVPKSVLDIVDTSVVKGTGPQALVEALQQLL